MHPGYWFDLEQVWILDYRQSLDLHRGVLERSVRFADVHNRISRYSQRRLVYMGMLHIAALASASTLVAKSWAGCVEFRSALDGRVVNDGVARYRGLSNCHLEPLAAQEYDSERIFLKMRTSQSHQKIALAVRTRLYRNTEHIALQPACDFQPDYIAQHYRIDMEAGDSQHIGKCVALYCSHDRAITECGLEALDAVSVAGPFQELLSSHCEQWSQLWNRFDIGIREMTVRPVSTMP